MENLKKIVFFIFLALTATFSTGSETHSTKHDITTLLNNSITKSFENMDAESIEELIFSIENLNSTKFEKTLACEIGPFKNKFYFTGINITLIDSQYVHVHRRFVLDEVTIFCQKLIIRIDAYLGATNDTVHVGFSRFIDFDDFLITVVGGMPVESLCDNYGYRYDNYKSHYANSPWFHPEIDPDSRTELERKIYQQLPSLLYDNLGQNERFFRSLHPMFSTHAKKEIKSTYTDFTKNKQQYYYFIPNVTSLSRTLSNITLTGLCNFQTHVFHVSLGRPLSTLLIRDIRGNANLFYGSQTSGTIFPLQFEIFGVTITMDQERQLVDVKTYDYSINETTSNKSLTKYQSEWIMEGIQLAIASSIMPSKKIYRHKSRSTSTKGQHPIAKVITTISDQFRGNIMEKLNSTWSNSVPNITRIESNLQIDSADYNISIETNEAIIMSIIRPVRIICHPYNNLETIFQNEMDSYLYGKITLRNTTHVFNDMDFAVGNILINLAKWNNSNEHDDYGVITHENVILTRLIAKQPTFDNGQLLIIDKKAKKMLISLIKKNLILYVKSLFSATLDYCTSPVKIFDDFLPFYAEYELPYIVPDIDNATSTEQLFVSKIHNVVISEWHQFDRIYLWFPSHNDNQLVPSINFELGSVNIRLNLNDTLFNFNELEVIDEKLLIQNYIDEGKIRAEFYGFRGQFRTPATNKSISRRESSWFKKKLEYLIENSFK